MELAGSCSLKCCICSKSPLLDEYKMTIRLALIAGLLAALLCANAQSQTYKPFPGQTMNKRTLDTQERVEALYVAGDFDRALLIYEKELAPLGDKYAQYMVGYMHLNAHGVSRDKITALAWYRIAAERGEAVLQQARDELIETMTTAEVTVSNGMFLDLWQSIGDTRLIMELIREDMNILQTRTGSRIRGATTSGPALIYRPSGELLPPNYYRDVRVRLAARLNYLEIKVEVRDLDVESDDEALKLLEQQVKTELAALEVP